MLDIAPLLKTCRRLLDDVQGNFSMILGLTAIALASAVALGVDYAQMSTTRATIQDVLDAAVLAAAKEPTEAASRATFDNYLSNLSAGRKGEWTFTAAIVSDNGTELVGEANVTVNLAFAPVFGVETAPISVRAAASRNAAPYQELVFAVDLSSSTGMGATDEDRAAIGALTLPYTENLLAPRTSWYAGRLPQGCAFACHRSEGWEPDNKTVYQMVSEYNAKLAPNAPLRIKLREDELFNQFGGLVDLLLDPGEKAVREGRRRISVLGFSNYGKPLIRASASAAAIKDSLHDFPDHDRYESVFANAFSAIEAMVGEQGGGSQADPMKTIILITDGIESRDAFFSQKPVDNKFCSDLKDKGFRLAVVELKYPKLLENYLYRDTVEPVEKNVSPTLESCASPDWYFRATDNNDVPVKFRELNDQLSGAGPVRLTQ